MARCTNCEGHVSDAFARVFAGDDDRPQRCPACATTRELQDGAAANGVSA